MFRIVRCVAARALWTALALLVLALAGCIGEDGADGAGPADGDDAELPAASNATAAPLLEVEDAFGDETELVLLDDTVTVGHCYGTVNQPLITASEALSGNVMVGCAEIVLPEGATIPPGTARLRIEADATQALRSGSYFPCLYTSARTTPAEANGEPSSDPVNTWTFELVPGEWDAPSAQRTAAWMCYWTGGGAINHLEGPIQTRVVAERDPSWEPEPVADPWTDQEGNNVRSHVLQDEDLTWTHQGTWLAGNFMGDGYWARLPLAAPIPVGTEHLTVAVSWSIGDCIDAEGCGIEYALGGPRTYHWIRGEEGDEGVASMVFAREDFEPDNPYGEESAWFTDVWPVACDAATPSAAGAFWGGCLSPMHDAAFDVRVRVEAWREPPDVGLLTERLGAG